MSIIVVPRQAARYEGGARKWTRDEPNSTHLITSASPITVPPFTVSIWIKRTIDMSGDDHCIWQIEDDGQTSEYFRLTTNTGTNDIRFIAASSGSDDFIITKDTVLNVWHQVVIVVAAINSRKGYIDGGSEASDTKTQNISTTRMSIGREGDSTPDDGWEGFLHDLCLWNVAFTVADVKALFDQKVRGDQFKRYKDKIGLYSPLGRSLRDYGPRGLTITDITPVAGVKSFQSDVGPPLRDPPREYILVPDVVGVPIKTADLPQDVRITSTATANLGQGVRIQRTLTATLDQGFRTFVDPTTTTIVQGVRVLERETADLPQGLRVVGIGIETDTILQGVRIQVTATADLNQALLIQINPTQTVAQGVRIQTTPTADQPQGVRISSGATSDLPQSVLITSVATANLSQGVAIQAAGQGMEVIAQSVLITSVATSTITQETRIQVVATADLPQSVVIAARATQTLPQSVRIKAVATANLNQGVRVNNPLFGKKLFVEDVSFLRRDVTDDSFITREINDDSFL